MRVLIIGASGFIGQYLLRRLQGTPGDEVTGTYHSRMPQPSEGSWRQVDLEDQSSLDRAFRQARPQVVVLLAAIADVGTAERDPARAASVNVEGTVRVARLCARHSARLVFLSTEYVFPGDRGNYREDEPPRPTTAYGRTKYQAELAIAREAPEWSILRTSLVYGWPIPGRRNMATVVLDRLRQGDTFAGHTDVYRTPVYVEHLTEGVARLVAEHHPGIHHLAGADWVSMYQFARSVAQVFQLDAQLVLPSRRVTETSPGSVSPAGTPDPPAPDILGLDSARTGQRLGLAIRGLVAGLAEMRDGLR